ncbi:Peroxisomal membrane 22 kDa family protein isoform 1 [Theobroma cacao]|uniref:Peroxisomal membrane 22 kDa family protein isoform 1 n=1 Tax=Theobroma cacao TaxID=3641 RepID=A0A061GMM9_THECC|nr:Peroxisomal membrane 22 kDa family protein isoform 1 [Theobroma cacao]
MLRMWKWYQSCLSLHPVKTQVISSGFLWGFGDIAAQYITHSTAKKRLQYKVSPKGNRTTQCIAYSIFFSQFELNSFDEEQEFKVNWKRVAITSMFGFGFVGPVGHFWYILLPCSFPVVLGVGRAFDRYSRFLLRLKNRYEGLDKFIKMRLHLRPKSARFVATKVAMDGLIFGPFDLFVFFTYMGFSTGKSVAQVKEDVMRDFLPALILEGGVWPIVQVANFRYVPVRYQLLYVNIFCLLDSAFLSWIEQQKDAPWKQRFSSFTSLKERGGQGRL